MRHRRSLPWGAAFAVAMTAMLGAPQAAIAKPKVHTIVIDKLQFGPVPADIHVGDTILWVNKDIFRHTATARDRSFDVDLAPSANGKTVVRRSGVVPFYCTFHPGMKGQLVIAK